ncbi:MAG TPA: TAXI family TRAP transporter solute-binding subunit [Stellaceae bacterium]|nr:TAXI family TRAP transporter solute-binding subunit [Stellaceae bacterium]
MAQPEHWANPVTTRSLVMLEIAAALVAGDDVTLQQAQVQLKQQGSGGWNLRLFGSGAFDGIDAVLRREADLATINPAQGLMMAHRGLGPYASPQPVRQIAVIPSYDTYAFAVRPELGLACFEDIAVKKPRLVFALRGQREHCMNVILRDLCKAAGFALEDINSWGGEVRYDGTLPFPDGPKFAAAVKGETNALIDEAADVWTNEAIDAGLVMLPMAAETVAKLEARGYRGGVMKKSMYPKLPRDYPTIDFSGWPIFCHAELHEERVRAICEALDRRKHLILWQGAGPLPVERMCREAEDTPQLVPYHPAAERYWRERGYL